MLFGFFNFIGPRSLKELLELRRYDVLADSPAVSKVSALAKRQDGFRLREQDEKWLTELMVNL